MKESNQAERKADLCGLTEQQGRKKLRTYCKWRRNLLLKYYCI